MMKKKCVYLLCCGWFTAVNLQAAELLTLHGIAVGDGRLYPKFRLEGLHSDNLTAAATNPIKTFGTLYVPGFGYELSDAKKRFFADYNLTGATYEDSRRDNYLDHRASLGYQYTPTNRVSLGVEGQSARPSAGTLDRLELAYDTITGLRDAFAALHGLPPQPDAPVLPHPMNNTEIGEYFGAGLLRDDGTIASYTLQGTGYTANFKEMVLDPLMAAEGVKLTAGQEKRVTAYARQIFGGTNRLNGAFTRALEARGLVAFANVADRAAFTQAMHRISPRHYDESAIAAKVMAYVQGREGVSFAADASGQTRTAAQLAEALAGVADHYVPVTGRREFADKLARFFKNELNVTFNRHHMPRV